jgi:hypothetical protein
MTNMANGYKLCPFFMAKISNSFGGLAVKKLVPICLLVACFCFLGAAQREPHDSPGLANGSDSGLSKEKAQAKDRMRREVERANNRGDTQTVKEARESERKIDKAKSTEQIRQIERDYNRGVEIRENRGSQDGKSKN